MADRDVQIKISVETAAGSRAVRALGADLDAVAGGVTRQWPAAEKSIGRIEPAARKAAGGVEHVGEVAGGASRQMRALGDVGETALGRMGRAGDLALGVVAGGAAVAATNAVLDVGAAAFTVAADFEQAGADLSAITGVMGADLRALEGTAIEASIRTGQSAGAQLEAFKLIASNIDVTTDELQTMGEQVVTLAVAAGVDLPRAADAATNTLNQFGLAASDTARVVNVLAAGAKEGAAEVPDLADAMREAGTTAAGANVSLEATVGALEVLAQNAQKGSQAGTGLRNVITILQTETEKLAEAGIRGVNVEGDGLVATLQKLTPLLSNAGALTDIFGRENLNAARILIANAGAVDTMTAAVTGTNVAQEQAAIQADTLRGDLDKLRAAFEALLLEGGNFNESLRALVQTGTDVLLFLRDHWDALSLAAKITAIATAAVVSFRVEAMLSARATALMAGAATLMGNAQAANAGATGIATAAVAAFNTAVRANPVGLVLGVLGAAATAMLVFRDDADEATGALSRQQTQAENTAAAIRTLSREAATARLEINETEQAAIRASFRQGLDAPTGASAAGDRLGGMLAPGALAEAAGQLSPGRQTTARDGTMTPLTAQMENDTARLRSLTDERTALRERLDELGRPVEEVRPTSSGAAGAAGTSDKDAEARRNQTEQDAEDMVRFGEVIVTAKREQAERMTLNERRMHEASLREAHQTTAARLALVEDEFARRAQLLDNDARLATELRTSQLAGVREERDAAVAAAEEAYAAEVARIDRLRPARERSAAEQRAVDAAAEQRTASRLAADLDAEEARVATEEEAAQTRDRLSQERRQLATDEANHQVAEFQREAAADDAVMDRRGEQEKRLKAARAEAHAEQMRQIQEAADATLQMIGLATQIYQNQSDGRLQQIGAEAQAADARFQTEQQRAAAAHTRRMAEMRARGGTDAQIASAETAHETAMLGLEGQRQRAADEFARREREEKRRAAVAERAAALFSIAIQTAINATKSALNPFQLAGVLALGALQSAAVLSQPLPEFAYGTDSAPAGFALVGERGPEIVNLPGGSSVLTNARAERLGAAMQALGASRGSGGALPPGPDAGLHQLVREQTAAVAAQTAALTAELGEVRTAVASLRLELSDEQIGRAGRRFDDIDRRTSVPFTPL